MACVLFSFRSVCCPQNVLRTNFSPWIPSSSISIPLSFYFDGSRSCLQGRRPLLKCRRMFFRLQKSCVVRVVQGRNEMEAWKIVRFFLVVVQVVACSSGCCFLFRKRMHHVRNTKEMIRRWRQSVFEWKTSLSFAVFFQTQLKGRKMKWKTKRLLGDECLVRDTRH